MIYVYRYLADTLSKTDKIERTEDENKKYFLKEVYNHMDKVTLYNKFIKIFICTYIKK